MTSNEWRDLRFGGRSVMWWEADSAFESASPEVVRKALYEALTYIESRLADPSIES